MAWISVREYCKRHGIKTAQIVYNKIATGRLKEEWREVEITVKRKQIKV